jgi:hypothetical protein
MAGTTNRGKFKFLDWLFRGTALPTNFYIALVTSATAPIVTTNTKSQLTEIAANTSGGYQTGGISLSKNSTDFDTLTQDDVGNKGLVQLKDIVWTAPAGESLPKTGNGARYAVLTDDNATQGSRLILVFWDLSADRTVSTGQTLTVQNCELDFTE